MTDAETLSRGPAGKPLSRAAMPRLLLASALLVRAVVGGLFVWAGLLKLSHPRAFAHVVDEYGIVPDGWPLVVAAFALPLLELVAGVGVMLGREAGHWLALALLGVFVSVLWFGILNDLDVDCGCFSLEERRGQASLEAAFVRDWAMAAGLAWCLYVRRRARRAGTAPGLDNERGK